MYHGFHTVKEEPSQMPSSLSSGKHRSMKMSAAGQHSSDQEGKNRNQIRRRIQLACTRCRRRKIRCSGETHDGAACTNCKAAGCNDCRFLRPETTQVVPAPGSALAFPYLSMVTSASSDSFGGRIHHHQQQQHTVSSNLSPPMYAVPYPRSQSLSDLGNYNRVDSLQREPPYANGLSEDIYGAPYSLHSQSCISTTSASDTMVDYYGSLGSPKWNNAVAMAADLARSQSAIFYAADVPSLFPTANLLSPGDLPTSRVLPMPATSGPSSMNVGSNSTAYLRDIEMAATSGIPFIPGEEDLGNIYPTESSRSLSSLTRANKPAAIATTEPFPNAFGGLATSSHAGDKSDILISHHHHHHQNYMMRYTAITPNDSSLDTLPITASSTFTRSSTSDSSDIEEPLMMSMNGLKNGSENNDKTRSSYHHHHHNSKSSAAYGYESMARPTRMTQANSAIYSNANNIGGHHLLQSSSSAQGISLGHGQNHPEY